MVDPVEDLHQGATHQSDDAGHLLEQGYPADWVADRPGYDVRCLTPQQRPLAKA